MPTAPATEQRGSAEDIVLRRVSESQVRTSELMEQAQQLGLSPAEVREVVWELLDEGSLGLTPDRHLTVLSAR